ncbi:MAG: LLM class flavin-dependent oxidoreductase [Chthoniobacterales bacterium]
MTTYSLLDLAPICEGSDASAAFRNSRDLAQHAEKWGYHRYWLAEHHNLPGIGSAATAVLIGDVARATNTLRVGAGGIMLPNHPPLVVAEQFGTLEALFPGRIDLAVGRAPGSDAATAKALRRYFESADSFPQDLAELMSYFEPAKPNQRVRAIPGEGLRVPIYLLGSSTFSATLAAELGLPFAFASHFAPDYLHLALKIYRSEFKPSAVLKQPHAMIGAGVYAAETDGEAERIFSSAQIQGLNLIRGRPGKLPPPTDDVHSLWSADERMAIEHRTRYAAVGGPEKVQGKLREIIDETDADEIILTAQIFDHSARLRSFEIAATLLGEMRSGAKVAGAAVG